MDHRASNARSMLPLAPIWAFSAPAAPFGQTTTKQRISLALAASVRLVPPAESKTTVLAVVETLAALKTEVRPVLAPAAFAEVQLPVAPAVYTWRAGLVAPATQSVPEVLVAVYFKP